MLSRLWFGPVHSTSIEVFVMIFWILGARLCKTVLPFFERNQRNHDGDRSRKASGTSNLWRSSIKIRVLGGVDQCKSVSLEKGRLGDVHPTPQGPNYNSKYWGNSFSSHESIPTRPMAITWPWVKSFESSRWVSQRSRYQDDGRWKGWVAMNRLRHHGSTLILWQPPAHPWFPYACGPSA